MRPFSIRNLMLAIAVIAVLLAGYIECECYLAGCTYTCTRSAQCASNMRNVVLSMLVYSDDKNTLPSGTWHNSSLAPEHRLSWCAAILPNMENPELFEALDKCQPWYGESNVQLASTRLGVLNCPSCNRLTSGGLVATPYIGIAGVGSDAPLLPKGHPRAGVFGYDRRIGLADMKDGASQTMVLAESGRVAGSWTAGGPATVRGLDPAEQPYIGPWRQFGGLHDRIVNVAFADGSVRGISESVDPRIFEASSTIAGGETLPSGDDW
jgi:prepilin-type processing-associated H-X9-DG protein